MAVLAEVTAKNYWSRRNGIHAPMPIGSKVVVRGIPAALAGKLKKIKDVDDSELIVNDSPEAADLRAQGKDHSADKLMADAKANASNASDNGDNSAEVAELRAKYEELTGGKANGRWKLETLREKVEEAEEAATAPASMPGQTAGE